MSALPEEEIDKFHAELAVVLRREAALRERTTLEILELQARIHPLTKVVGERGQLIEELRHRERTLRLELKQATADLETFAWMLQAAEKSRDRARNWTPLGWLRALRHLGRGRGKTKVPPGDFIYHLTPSPFRIYQEADFTLRGWVYPRDGRAVTAIRARLNGQVFAAQSGLPAPDAIAQHGAQPKNPHPGFEVKFETPPGRHHLGLEACFRAREWRSILEIPIWCQTKR